jgi:hypothetical protein
LHFIFHCALHFTLVISGAAWCCQGLLDEVVEVLDQRIRESGRTVPVPKLSERALKRLEKEAAIKV